MWLKLQNEDELIWDELKKMKERVGSNGRGVESYLQ